MTNEEYARIQEQARKDAEAGRAASNQYTPNGRASDLYNQSYNQSQPKKD